MLSMDGDLAKVPWGAGQGRICCTETRRKGSTAPLSVGVRGQLEGEPGGIAGPLEGVRRRSAGRAGCLQLQGTESTPGKETGLGQESRDRVKIEDLLHRNGSPGLGRGKITHIKKKKTTTHKGLKELTKLLHLN